MLEGAPHGGQRALDLLELELQEVLSRPDVGAGNLGPLVSSPWEHIF